MRLDLFRSLWGWQGDWAICAAEVRRMGAVGVEARLPGDLFAQRALRQSLQQEALDYIAVVFTGGDVVPRQDWTLQQHWDRLEANIAGAQDVGARFLNVLPGNDRWPLAKQVEFFGRAQALADAAGAGFDAAADLGLRILNPLLGLGDVAQVDHRL